MLLFHVVVLSFARTKLVRVRRREDPPLRPYTIIVTFKVALFL
jgi:hypothetical protein